jgi:Mg2+ and Co2+ transporter CorA
VNQFLARLRNNDEGLFVILGGRTAMIESPLYQELKEEWACEAVIDVLVARFGPEAKSLETELKAISKESRLKELLKHAATCRSLAAFRKKLEP